MVNMGSRAELVRRRLSPARSSAPGLIPGASTAAISSEEAGAAAAALLRRSRQPATARRLCTATVEQSRENSYLTSLIRTVNWSELRSDEKQELMELASDAKTRKEISVRSHQCCPMKHSAQRQSPSPALSNSAPASQVRLRSSWPSQGAGPMLQASTVVHPPQRPQSPTCRNQQDLSASMRQQSPSFQNQQDLSSSMRSQVRIVAAAGPAVSNIANQVSIRGPPSCATPREHRILACDISSDSCSPDMSLKAPPPSPDTSIDVHGAPEPSVSVLSCVSEDAIHCDEPEADSEPLSNSAPRYPLGEIQLERQPLGEIQAKKPYRENLKPQTDQENVALDENVPANKGKQLPMNQAPAPNRTLSRTQSQRVLAKSDEITPLQPRRSLRRSESTIRLSDPKLTPKRKTKADDSNGGESPEMLLTVTENLRKESSTRCQWGHVRVARPSTCATSQSRIISNFGSIAASPVEASPGEDRGFWMNLASPDIDCEYRQVGMTASAPCLESPQIVVEEQAKAASPPRPATPYFGIGAPSPAFVNKVAPHSGLASEGKPILVAEVCARALKQIRNNTSQIRNAADEVERSLTARPMRRAIR